MNLSYADKNVKRSFAIPVKAINISNSGYVFNPFADGKNNDERTLVGKKLGIVLHEEEYETRDGKIRTSLRTYPWGIVNVEKVKSGDFNQRLLEKVPLQGSTTTTGSETFMNVPDTETPFN